MFKVLIAPAAFKGTFSPIQVAEAITLGVERWSTATQVRALPLADGGDGTIAALHTALGGKLHQLTTTGALGQPVSAVWLELDNIAVIELASTCGIAYLPADNLNALSSHTFGLGEAIKDCLNYGQKEIVITLGGSASSDGGTGALTALGAVFADKNGRTLPLGAQSLKQLDSVDFSGLTSLKTKAKFKIACDVNSPLLGATGAAYIFAPQKGATKEQVLLIEDALTHLANVLETKTQKQLRHLPGIGAAGGTAFGLALALDAELISGFNWFAELTGLNQHILNSDFIISAEGSLDAQSLPGQGKGLGNLISICQVADRPLAILAAHVDPTIDWPALGVKQIIELSQGGKLVTSENISHAAAELYEELNLSQSNR